MAYTRRQFISSSTIALAGSAIARVPLAGQTPPAGAAPQQPAAPPVTKFEEIRGGVGYFTGQGGTIGYLVTPDGAIAVDAQFPATAKICVEGLQAKAPKGIQLLISTHHHADHTAGNVAFKDVVKHIVQQERCAALQKEVAEKAAKPTPQAYGDVTFGESWSQAIGAEKVWAHHYGPGHTGGDAVITFEKANVLHMGDLMFNRMHPRVDRPAGASIKNWISTLEKVAAKHKDATFIFGHAKAGLPVTGTAKELLYLRDYFTAVMAHVSKALKAGQTQERIVGLEVLPGFEDFGASGQVLTLKGVLTAAFEELK